MKRILFVSEEMGMGGSQNQIVELANGLCETGFKVAVLVFDTKGKNGAKIKDFNAEVEIFSPNGRRPNLFLPGKHLEIVKVVRRWKPDILCSLTWDVKCMTAIVGRFFGAKVILGAIQSPVLSISHKKFRTLIALYRKSVYRLADAVIAVSSGVAREISNVYKLKNVKTVYNGIDIERIKAESEGEIPHEYFRGDIPVIVSVGRLTRAKGYKHLLEAFGIVNETTEARLLIIGDGKLKDEMVHKAKTLGLHDKIAMVEEREPYRYMRRECIFVLSSIYEGFPTVLLEATSLGMSVVTTDCDHGPREIIENGENGLLVPVANPKELALAILKLIRNKELRLDLASEAEKRARRFTREKMVAGYKNVLLNL